MTLINKFHMHIKKSFFIINAQSAIVSFSNLRRLCCKIFTCVFLRENSRGVARGGGFGRSVNPIQTRGADYVHSITIRHPRLQNPNTIFDFTYRKAPLGQQHVSVSSTPKKCKSLNSSTSWLVATSMYISFPI